MPVRVRHEEPMTPKLGDGAAGHVMVSADVVHRVALVAGVVEVSA
jgi:hypothetical protein